MMIGTTMMLFAAFQLWGTGLQASASQTELSGQLDEMFAAAPIPTAAPANDTPLIALPSDGTTAGTTEVASTATLQEVTDLYVDEGMAMARISIPKIEVDQAVVEGVGVDDLRKGPGHYRGTSWPGQPGNVGIAGHRTTYGAPFHRVDELVPGDEINIRTLQGTFTYRVIDTEGDGNGNIIVNPADDYVLNDYGDNRITLTACHPKYSAAQRIIVFGELVGEPAPLLPRPEDWKPPAQTGIASETGEGEPALDGTDGEPSSELAGADDATTGGLAEDGAGLSVGETAADAEANFGEGLDGDRGAIVPTLMWAAVLLAIWFGAQHLGRRLGRFYVYAAAAIPFAFVMWTMFKYLDRALPSY